MVLGTERNEQVFGRVFKRFRRRREQPLSGAPAVRRIKSYSAQSGYVFEYCYLGHRAMQEEEGVEHCFETSWSRRPAVTLSVFVPQSSLEAWETRQARELAANERYAVAKMALFQAFDEREPARMTEPVRVRAADVDAIIETLGLE